MKKVLCFILFGVLLATAAKANVANPVTVSSTGTQVNVNYENQTNFGHVAAFGADKAGNPGMFVLKGCDASGACFPYYFWVDTSGNLKQASYLTISAYASFPNASFGTSSMGGLKVGAQ